MDPNFLTLMVFLEEVFENIYFEKKSADDEKHAKLFRRQAINKRIVCVEKVNIGKKGKIENFSLIIYNSIDLVATCLSLAYTSTTTSK